MRYQLTVRLASDDVGSRVVIRWRRPAQSPDAAGSADDLANDQVTDVLGILEAVDEASFTVRKADGAVVAIPRHRALAGKVIPPPAKA